MYIFNCNTLVELYENKRLIISIDHDRTIRYRHNIQIAINIQPNLTM